MFKSRLLDRFTSFHWAFSISLIIHQVKIKSITTTKEVWIPGPNYTDFDDLFLPLLLGFCFDWEDISNSRDSVSSAIQTPRLSSKILRCAAYFQLSSRCLDIPMNHCLSRLIYFYSILLDVKVAPLIVNTDDQIGRVLILFLGKRETFVIDLTLFKPQLPSFTIKKVD